MRATKDARKELPAIVHNRDAVVTAVIQATLQETLEETLNTLEELGVTVNGHNYGVTALHVVSALAGLANQLNETLHGEHCPDCGGIIDEETA